MKIEHYQINVDDWTNKQGSSTLQNLVAFAIGVTLKVKVYTYTCKAETEPIIFKR